MKRKMIGAIFLIIMLAISPSALAEYPDKPITMIVAFDPGGATDVSTRVICDLASKIIGQPIVVINKSGGTGSVALASLKKEKPDGYTICTVAGGIFISQHLRELPFDITKDFTPIIRYGDYGLPVLVRADSPWKTFKELVQYAKANPGKIRYGTSGSGSVYHLAMEALALQEGIKWIHIPFKGGNTVGIALLGGHIEVENAGPSELKFVRSGQLRLLSSFGHSRLPSYPEIPTWSELGYNITMNHLAAFVGPKDMPKAVVDKLHGAFKAAMEKPEFKRVMKDQEMPIVYRNPDDLSREFKELTDYYKKIVKQIELKE